MKPEIFQPDWVIPRGETVLASDYPELADIIGEGRAEFALPDLTEINTPIDPLPQGCSHALHCLAIRGEHVGRIAAFPLPVISGPVHVGDMLTKRSGQWGWD